MSSSPKESWQETDRRAGPRTYSRPDYKPTDLMKEYWKFFEFRGWSYDTFMSTPVQIRVYLLSMLDEKMQPEKWLGAREFSEFRVKARSKGITEI